jgi:hypothetical protein
MRSIEEVERELAELKRAEQSRKAALKASTPIQYRFTITPAEGRHRYHKSYDDTCAVYELRGEILNEAEARAVGHDTSVAGGAAYLYNRGTGRIVCLVSGGRIWISEAYTQNDGADETAFRQIGQFLAEHPEGGDISDIVNEFRAVRALWPQHKKG